MRRFLADHTSLTAGSLIYQGVDDLSGVKVRKAHTKLGILNTLRSEFAFLRAGGINGMRKYAVLALGILPKRVGTVSFDEEEQGEDLGARIHNALTLASP